MCAILGGVVIPKDGVLFPLIVGDLKNYGKQMGSWVVDLSREYRAARALSYLPPVFTGIDTWSPLKVPEGTNEIQGTLP